MENYSYDNEPNLSRWPSSQSAVTCLPLFHDDLLSKIRTLRVGSFVHSRIIILNNASTRLLPLLPAPLRRVGQAEASARVPSCAGRKAGENQWRVHGKVSAGREGEFYSRCPGLLPAHRCQILKSAPSLVLTYISHGRLYDNGVSVAEWEVSALCVALSEFPKFQQE